jgi:hypothetical protein
MLTFPRLPLLVTRQLRSLSRFSTRHISHVHHYRTPRLALPHLYTNVLPLLLFERRGKYSNLELCLHTLMLHRNSTHPTMTSLVLGLSLELRHKIWEFVFEGQIRTKVLTTRSHSGKCMICKASTRVRTNRSLRIILADKQLGLDAQAWLFARSKTAVFHSYYCFRKTLARTTSWGLLRSMEILKFPYFYTNECGKAICKEALARARRMRDRLNEAYPGDVVDIDWEAVMHGGGSHCYEVELRRKTS